MQERRRLTLCLFSAGMSAITLMPARGLLPSLEEKEVASMQHRHELVPTGPLVKGTTELVVLVVATVLMLGAAT